MAESTTQEGLNNIIQAIQNIVDTKTESLKFDKTYRAKVIAKVEEGTYKVSINDVTYTLPYNGTLTVGDIIKVKSPLNNFSDKYIEGATGGGGGGTTNYNNLTNKPVLNTSFSSTLVPQTTETLQGTINLHKISKTGSYNDLLNKPIIPTQTSQLTNNGDGNSPFATKQYVDDKVSTVYKYKGSVATYNNLPTTGNQIGDVWNVEDTGKNYAWTGTAWDDLGGTIDLSNYYTKSQTYSQTEINNLLNNKISTNQIGIANGIASLDASGKITSSQLPIATASNLGVFKVGANLSITADGTLNATGGTGTEEVSISPTEPTDTGLKLWVDTSENPSGSVIRVIDNLTSTSTTDALSANQGRILRENGLIVSSTEPTTGEKVWLQPNSVNGDKIYIKNDNGGYDEFKKEEDSGWIDLTVNSNFTNYDWEHLAYRKIGKVVYIHGGGTLVKGSNNIIAVFPTFVRARQNIQTICAVDSSTSICNFELNYNGNFELKATTSTATSIRVMFNFSYIAR